MDELNKPDDATLQLAFRFSLNGMPIFACSAKPPAVARKMDNLQEYLWVDNVPPYTGNGESWWRNLTSRAASDRSFWWLIQEDMAKFLSYIEVQSKPGVGWTIVAPETSQFTSRNAERFLDSGSVPGIVDGGGSGRSMPRTVGAQSALRHEVSQN